MPAKAFFQLLSISFGIALLLAGLFFNASLASPIPQAVATPTRDRLAQPTLPASPSQADHGAQVYWLSCLPCHGDLGQGLTDEFRMTYPPEDRNCWESGCHGARPYENGFKLPKAIPAVIGQGTLQKFSNASALQSYIKATMPFWKPGSLTDEESWAVTAFLLRENSLREDRAELNASNADQARIRVADAESTPEPPVGNEGTSAGWSIGGGAAILLFLLWLARRSLKSARTES